MMDVMKGLFASDRPTGATVRRRTPAVRQSSPIGAISGMIEEARGDLSSSIRGLFGQQTPEEAQIQELQEIKTAYTDAVLNVGDPNTPEGLKEVARKLNNNPNPNIQMVGVRLRQQADMLEEKRKVAQRTEVKDLLGIVKTRKEIDTMGIPKPNVLPDSEMLIAQGLGIPTNDNFGNPRDITSYTQEESNAIMKKREEQRRSVAKAGSGKFNDITMKEVVDFKKSFGLNFEGDAVSSLESINQIESFLQNAPASGLGGTIIPQLQRAFIKLAEGSSARVSDKDVENILGVENFVDTQVSSLEKFIGGKLSSKKIQSLKELTELYKKQAIKSYNRRVKVAKEDVNRVAFNKNKKDSLINSIPPVEFYLKSPTESTPVGQTRVILKEIEGLGTVTVRIKENSNTTTQEKEEQLGTGTLPSKIPQ